MMKCSWKFATPKSCPRISSRWRTFLCFIITCQLAYLFISKKYNETATNNVAETYLSQYLTLPHKIGEEIPVSLPFAKTEELEEVSSKSTVENVMTLSSSIKSQDGALRDCTLPIPSPVNFSHTLDVEAYSWNKLDSLISNHLHNGTWWPKQCAARHHVAVIVAYRARDEQLRVFLHNLHQFLQRQNIHYAIFIIEQASGLKFNRASLLNVGFLEATQNNNLFDCFVFHDVDLLPEDNRNLYICGESPRHMSTTKNKYQYQLPYAEFFGGVSALNKNQFLHVNGFSNAYFGWGGEDDDLANRLVLQGIDFVRYPLAIGRYYMLHHGRDKGNKINPVRNLLVRNGGFRMKNDGLNSLRYTVIDRHKHRLMVHIVVQLDKAATLKAISTEIEKESTLYLLLLSIINSVVGLVLQFNFFGGGRWETFFIDSNKFFYLVQLRKSQSVRRKASLQGFTIWQFCLVISSLLYLVVNANFIFRNVLFVMTKFCNCKRSLSIT